MRIEFIIDWLAFTTPLSLMPSPELYTVFPPKSGGFTAVQAHNGYKTAYRNGYGALCQWNTERPEMRVLTQYSGTTLARYQDENIRPTSLLQLHAIKDGSRLTRIDLAFDLHDTGLSISEQYESLKRGNAKAATSKANLIVGVTGGTTLYIGSRQSDKFLRIYDKAAEQEIPGDWVRVELEIKGDTAQALGKQISMASEYELAAIAKGMLWSMVQFPDEIWQNLCSESSPVGFSISHKKSDNLKSWLADQVAPAVGNYILKGGDTNIIDQLDVMVWAFLNRKSRL
jgi:DNA relaxase NicK